MAKAGTSFVIPNIVKTIRSSAFKGCTSLTSITIPESVETIGSGAFDVIFYDSDGKTELDQTAEKLAGSIFNKVDGKLIKQKVFGKCGDAVSYELDLSTGALTINGSGKMEIYSGGKAPWFSYKGTINSITMVGSVTSIGDFSFEGITNIESILIPDSVESIGASAFAGCSKLATVNLGKSVKTINGSAFKDCTSIASYVVSENNGTYASIDGVLFSKDKATLIQYPVAKAGASYVIPNTVKTIRSSAFNGISLTTITIPNSVTTIEVGAFDIAFYDPNSEKELEPTPADLAGHTFNKVDGKWVKQEPTPSEDPDKESGECGKDVSYELDLFTGSLVISGSGNMESFSSGKAPWYSHKGIITSIVIGDNITTIGDHAFEGIISLGSITIPDSVESIGASAFEGCTELATIKLGKSVNSIGELAFKGCTGLTSIDIGDSVTSIGDSAFKDCTGLKELTVPAGLDCVGSNEHPIFEGCVNIEKITFTKGNGTWNNYDTGSSQSVSSRNNSKILNDNVSESLSELSDYIYTPWQLSRSTLISVIISDGVTSIGDSAFKDCTAINSLSLGNTVTTIGSYAFSGCTSLTSIVIPDSVTSIEDGAFDGIFYDTDGVSVISQIAGSTFEKIDGKWIKQGSAPIPDPSPTPSPSSSDAGASSNGSTMIYLFIAIVVIITLSAAFVVVKKKHA